MERWNKLRICLKNMEVQNGKKARHDTINKNKPTPLELIFIYIDDRELVGILPELKNITFTIRYALYM